VAFTEVSRYPSPSIGLQSLNYGLFSADGATQLSVDGSPAGAQETLIGSFPRGSKRNDSLNLPFLMKVFPTSLPPPGTTWINLRADLYANSAPSGRIVDTLNFYMSVAVAGYYDLSVVPTGGTFSLASTTAALAFGTLVAGAVKGTDILVKSNVSYSLGLSSLNGGAFANAADGSKLPYSLSVNGSAVALSPGIRTLVATNAQASYGASARYALLVTVLPFVGLPAQGSYSDTITVTLSAP
jgi:spore coat protein U-like protein